MGHGIKLQSWLVKSDGKVIKTLYCETLEQASAKLRHLYPKLYWCLEIVKGPVVDK